ncbi:MAG: phosphate ABC transporter ATP-binding protein PstB [Pseudomonadota bacterium]
MTVSDTPAPARLAHIDAPVIHVEAAAPTGGENVVATQALSAFYTRGAPALREVTLNLPRNRVTAIIGPSGCGKSTFIRCINRMNDTLPGFRTEGAILYHGTDICGPDIDPVLVRRRIGMVFQKPNPFPKSVFDNVAFAMRALRMGDIDDRVEHALKRAALWDEVKARLKQSALGLSGGQQQRLCIARTIAVEPDVVLLDEPASALDPISTAAIEDLIHELKRDYTIVIVTHNMQQAARIADRTAFFTLVEFPDGTTSGTLVEVGPTSTIFTHPSDPRTNDYVTGRVG